jgi:hypothetical protein
MVTTVMVEAETLGTARRRRRVGMEEYFSVLRVDLRPARWSLML